MLCVLSIGFVACDKRSKKEKNFDYPSSSAQVIGNGGLAVKKGNYVYFVNGYKSVGSISSKKDRYNVGSLMLMKLNSDGEVVLNDDGLVKDEYYITMSNKLCGYEVTNLFIFKDYLYFVTPSLENESGDKVWAKERVVFNRIKLDKTGEVEEVYNSGVKYDQLEYEFYEDDGNLFILVYEKGNSYYASNGNNALIRVNATAKSSTKVANNVSSVVFAENADEIFFVKDDASNSKYYLKKYDIGSNNVTDYYSDNKTFTAKFAANGKVYITKAHEFGSTTDIMVSTIEDGTGFELFYAYEGTPNMSLTPDGNTVVLVNENDISLVTGPSSVVTIEDAEATTISVIGFANGCVVYYDTTSEDSNIKLVSYDNALKGGDDSIKTLTTISTIETDCAYFDLSEDSYMYFYNKIGENYYLNRIKINNNLGETEEMFGVYNSADVPEVEEDEIIEEE